MYIIYRYFSIVYINSIQRVNKYHYLSINSDIPRIRRIKIKLHDVSFFIYVYIIKNLLKNL